jgi:ABC-type multidrug transport system ATPase subunit
MVIEPGKYRLALGYVPQDIHANLTVYQALFYSARLRLPPDFTNDDIDERFRSVLAQLHLEGTENVLIGSPEKKGISGGQRKRVNLAMELLTDPLVLFLDEPTSGLSSEDALVVMKVLRELANQARRSSSQFISRARRFSSCSTTW